MKKIVYRLLIILLLIVGATANADAKPIDPYKLPKKTQQFLRRTFFYAMPIAVDQTAQGYEVQMNEGTLVVLNKRGEWTYVQSNEGVPDAIIPRPIRNYLTLRFEDNYVSLIQRTTDGYQVTLNNGLLLTFDKQYRLVKVQ